MYVCATLTYEKKYYVRVCCNIAKKIKRIGGRWITSEEARNYIVEDCQMRGSVVATRIVAIIPFCACVSYGDNFILRMILVAITSKLPWSGLFLRVERVLSAACCAAKRKAIYIVADYPV